MGNTETNECEGNLAWRILRWLEVLLFTSGISLLLIYAGAKIESHFASRAALEKFSSTEPSPRADTREDAANEATVENDSADPDFSLWGEGRVRAYRAALDNRSGSPIAVLQVPSIGLVAPLFDGTDRATLNHAVGRIAETAWPGEPGNIGIAGHRDSFFMGLKDLKTGDAIELKTKRGIDTYIVDRTQIVTPRDVSVLQPRSTPSVTLVTCYPFYFIGSAPKRFVVTASLVQPTAAGPTTSDPRLLAQQRSSTKEKQ